MKYFISRGIDIIEGMNRLSIGPGKFESSEPWIMAALANYPGCTPEQPEAAASVPTTEPIKVAATTAAEPVDPEAASQARIDAIFEEILKKDRESNAS